MSDKPVLLSKALSSIITFWRPGSHQWGWADEYNDLIGDPVTREVDRRIRAEGFGFIDHAAPILLGNDGRVWDGHHRIVLAIKYQEPSLMVEMAGSDGID